MVSSRTSGGSDGRPGLGETAVHEVTAVLDEAYAASDALVEVFGRRRTPMRLADSGYPPLPYLAGQRGA